MLPVWWIAHFLLKTYSWNEKLHHDFFRFLKGASMNLNIQRKDVFREGVVLYSDLFEVKNGSNSLVTGKGKLNLRGLFITSKCMNQCIVNFFHQLFLCMHAHSHAHTQDICLWQILQMIYICRGIIDWNIMWFSMVNITLLGLFPLIFLGLWPFLRHLPNISRLCAFLALFPICLHLYLTFCLWLMG